MHAMCTKKKKKNYTGESIGKHYINMDVKISQIYIKGITKTVCSGGNIIILIYI